MIRTRDLVLFVVVLLFLGVGIVTTVLLRGADHFMSLVPIVVSDPVTSFGATEHTATPIDRAANIAHLREQLALDTSSIQPQPDVFVTDALPDAPTEVEEEEAAAFGTVAESIRACLYPDDVLPRIAAWPATGVTVAVRNGMLEVFTTEFITIDSLLATSSETTIPVSETVLTTLLALPLDPQKTPTASCVPSSVIGVTLGGTMMLNPNAQIWKNSSTDTLIGYARDGYPIYGRYDGVVDACGGYMHASGYRYSISPSRSFIVGCFTAIPQSFNL